MAPGQGAAAERQARAVLFICTANSARSIMAEAILNRAGRGRFRAFSAGSRPAPRAHPAAVALLRRRGHRTKQLQPKSWSLFLANDAPEVDLIITVCDQAAQSCPAWPGSALTAHWSMPDPERSGHDGFEAVYSGLKRRILALVRLPWEELDPAQIEQRLQEIGAFTHKERRRSGG